MNRQLVATLAVYANVCHFPKGDAISVTACCLPWQCDSFLLGVGSGSALNGGNLL